MSKLFMIGRLEKEKVWMQKIFRTFPRVGSGAEPDHCSPQSNGSAGLKIEDIFKVKMQGRRVNGEKAETSDH